MINLLHFRKTTVGLGAMASGVEYPFHRVYYSCALLERSVSSDIDRGVRPSVEKLHELRHSWPRSICSRGTRNSRWARSKP